MLEFIIGFVVGIVTDQLMGGKVFSWIKAGYAKVVALFSKKPV